MQANSLQEWNSPLTAEQTELLERLAADLSPEQARWAAGYLAGVHGALAASDRPQAATATAAPVTILYGSETGNAEGLAELACQRAEARGLSARVIDMADYKPRELRNERLILIITATHGEGDPPDPAEDFYRFVHGRKAPKLEGAKFAVLALGDSSYEHYCQTGRDFDARLEGLGAQRLIERVDCDVNFEDTAGEWIDRALDAFAEHADAARGDNVVAFGAPSNRPAPTYDRKNPLAAEVLDNTPLTGRGSDKETRHIELSIAESGLAFEPGDVLCLIPKNRPETVLDLTAALGLDASETVVIRNRELALGQALRDECEITLVAPPFVQAYAPLTGSGELAALAGEDRRKELMAYARSRQVLDVVLDYPPQSIDAQAFVDALRPLQPREYSIASSYNANPDEVHLTVAVVRGETEHGYREGAASGFLAGRVQPGDTVPVYVRRNKNFKLPADPDAPVIMVGPGTGVAPFRAFLEEREEAAAGGRNWLFFGERRFRTDFLYQIEWQRWLKDGVLTRMDVAFSRDGKHKVYVQDRMRERSRELYEWLEQGAYFYVCGDAERMAPDVHQTLIDIVREEGGHSDEQAAEYVKQLQRDKRYQRDVY
ncbi:MAG: assimilatory sulfite reductase (NADPH) flavoprotein subunit [Gammaproteobacteria bacterium]